MTNKKAIKRLQSWIDIGYYSLNNQDINWEDDKRALELAIKALEEVEERNKLKLICAVDNRIVGSLDTGDCPTILKPKQIER